MSKLLYSLQRDRAGTQTAKGPAKNTVSSASDAPLQRETRPPTEHLQGIVERVTYHTEESGYTIARLKVASASDLITIVGNFPSITAGQTLRLRVCIERRKRADRKKEEEREAKQELREEKHYVHML